MNGVRIEDSDKNSTKETGRTRKRLDEVLTMYPKLYRRPPPPTSAENHSSGVSVGLLIVGALSALAITVAIFANFFGREHIASGTNSPPPIERNSRISPVKQNGLID
jgi:hypothetical protein